MGKEILKEAFENYIKGTEYKAVVADGKFFLCHLTNAVCSGIRATKEIDKVYMTSRCLKHLFDSKPAEEFFFIIDNLHKVVKCPDRIYDNRGGKRGEYCLVKRIGSSEYLCSIEITKRLPIDKEIQIATAFRLRDKKYIKNYILLWSWRNDAPPS